MTGAGNDITVGVDIGTSSVKAVAVDGGGRIVARTRVPHEFRIPSANRLEHPAAQAWYEGPRRAVEALGIDEAAAVSVAAMVPSLTAVDEGGVPIDVGLLYGDERGRADRTEYANVTEIGELAAFMAWFAHEHPDAAGYWPAQAVANGALAGEAVISTTVAATALPLFDWVGWDPEKVGATGARVDQMPRIVPSLQPAGEVPSLGGAALEAGTIDAFGEQLVAGADDVGDVLVICGTTLITWCVCADEPGVADYYSIPHTAPGRWLHGGPSNAGGIFLDWVRRVVADVAAGDGAEVAPGSVPLWVPYPRGERQPLSDPDRRAECVGLDLTHGPAHLRRGAFEAAGFVVRRMIEASPATARRIVAVGGGIRVPEWMQALADCTGLPVDVSGTEHGAALGTAFIARVAAGLEPDTTGASRWASTRTTVEPRPDWLEACAERYERWRVRAD
jgi:xylulokinase